MLGGGLALLAAVTFAMNNAAFRRGVLTGTVAQAMAISLPLGTGLFLVAAVVTGTIGYLAALPSKAILLLSVAGILHFAWGRYCNFRATKAMGANLVGPAQQVSLIVSLGLAIWVLGEKLTPLRVLGIALVVLGPAVTLGPRAVAGEASPGSRPVAFRPNYAEGYTFALLSASGYGASPILVRMSLGDAGPGAGLAGGLVAYVAATLAMSLALVGPVRLRDLLSVERRAARWFTASGVLVCLSQMFGYMALAIAPVSVVTPIQRLSLVFRVFANSILNREHEIVGGRIWAATAIALVGALALSLSTEFVLSVVPLPDFLVAAARWQWP